jgi:hypothetical protein
MGFCWSSGFSLLREASSKNSLKAERERGIVMPRWSEIVFLIGFVTYIVVRGRFERAKSVERIHRHGLIERALFALSSSAISCCRLFLFRRSAICGLSSLPAVVRCAFAGDSAMAFLEVARRPRR